MADLTVRIVGDDTRLRAGLRSAERTLGGFSGKVKGFGKSIAGGVFGGALLTRGFDLFTNTLGDVISEAKEAQKVGRLTNAVIESTGGVAKVSARDVERLAESLSLKVGVDDELIQSGANLLLTFTNIRNEVGRGNDIFNQATATVLDMSAALGQDTKSSAIQLGKALNDPIRGITALRRVGVSFTEAQQDQIKVLVESGQTLEAQKIILGELSREFGGAAEAAASPFDKLKVAVDNAKERLGLALLPVLEAVANWLAVNIPAAIDEFIVAIKGGTSEAEGFAGVIGDIGENFAELKKILEGNSKDTTGWGKAFAKVMQFTRLRVTTEMDIIRSQFIFTGNVFSLVSQLMTQAWRLFGITFGVVVSGIVSLVEFAKATFTRLREVVEGVAARIRAAWSSTVGAFQKGVQGIVNGVAIVIGFVASLTAVIEGLPGRIRGALSGVTEIFVAPFRTAFETIRDIWDNTVGRLKPPDLGIGLPSIDVPFFAKGGIATGPKSGYLAILHGTEAVVPLNASGGVQSGPSGGVFQITIINEVGGREISRAVIDESTRQGGLPIRIRTAS